MNLLRSFLAFLAAVLLLPLVHAGTSADKQEAASAGQDTAAKAAEAAAAADPADEAAKKKPDRPAAVVKSPAVPSVQAESNTPHPPSEEQLKALKAIDKRYQTSKSVTMDLEKTLILGLLGKEKKSKGRVLISQGKMRMEIEEPQKSLVVIDGKTVWVADWPAPEFKNAAVQVMKGSVDTSKGASQGFVGLLARGGILKHFKITAVQNDEKGRSLYFLQPSKDTIEFKRAQMTLSADGRQITALRYWDERDNETQLQFSKVVFDKVVPEKLFQFSPPANADVSTF